MSIQVETRHYVEPFYKTKTKICFYIINLYNLYRLRQKHMER